MLADCDLRLQASAATVAERWWLLIARVFRHLSVPAIAAALICALPAAADEVGDFYRGKSATLYLGYPPGGAYDIYARLIARHLSRHMPGNPQFIVRHKPGAASLNL